jgi:hypothetical protein
MQPHVADGFAHLRECAMRMNTYCSFQAPVHVRMTRPTPHYPPPVHVQQLSSCGFEPCGYWQSSFCAMESPVSNGYRHGSLPKLSISKELSRRDSLSSSRTRDSGYNSDLDASFSPFDYLDLEQRMYRCYSRFLWLRSTQMSYLLGSRLYKRPSKTAYLQMIHSLPVKADRRGHNHV